MPPLDARRVHKLLPHIGSLLGQFPDARRGKLIAAHQPQRSHHHLHRAFDFGKAGILEKVRIEQNPQYRSDFIAGIDKSLRQQVNGRRVIRRRHRPRRHLRLIRHKEVVKMPGDEPGRGRMGANDVDDVLAVKVAAMPQETLFPVVVILLLVLELPVKAPVGSARNHRGNRPPGKGPRTLPHIRLGIVAHPHTEQLQQLPPPVLVDRIGVVIAVVQPVNHRRVFRQLHQQLPVVAHPPLPEQINLLEYLVVMVDFRVAGGKDLVPKENHFLL